MLSRDAGLLAIVDVGLAHAGPDRLLAITELTGDPPDRPVLGAELVTQLADEADRLFLLGRAVAAQRRALGLLLFSRLSQF